MAPVLVEEVMETSGRVEFEVGVARRSAVLVVLDKNISIARYWRYISNLQSIWSLNNVLLSTVEGGTTVISDTVADIVDGMKAIEYTSLNAAARVILSFSQEHGEPSGEQQ